MKALNSIRSSAVLRGTLALAMLVFPSVVQAQWRATVGAQSHDQGRQALAFLPNEIWIHAGDDITWTFDTDEIHTVTFLKAGQTRAPFASGCAAFPPGVPPVFSPSGSTFDGSACVSTPFMVKGQTFKVIFPKAGNYKLVCLVERATFRTADVSLATNQSYREIAIQRGGMPPDRVFIVRVSPEPEKMRRGSQFPELKHGKRNLVVYLGVMGPQDGVDIAIKMADVVVNTLKRLYRPHLPAVVHTKVHAA